MARALWYDGTATGENFEQISEQYGQIDFDASETGEGVHPDLTTVWYDNGIYTKMVWAKYKVLYYPDYRNPDGTNPDNGDIGTWLDRVNPVGQPGSSEHLKIIIAPDVRVSSITFGLNIPVRYDIELYNYGEIQGTNSNDTALILHKPIKLYNYGKIQGAGFDGQPGRDGADGATIPGTAYRCQSGTSGWRGPSLGGGGAVGLGTGYFAYQDTQTTNRANATPPYYYSAVAYYYGGAAIWNKPTQAPGQPSSATISAYRRVRLSYSREVEANLGAGVFYGVKYGPQGQGLLSGYPMRYVYYTTCYTPGKPGCKGGDGGAAGKGKSFLYPNGLPPGEGQPAEPVGTDGCVNPGQPGTDGTPGGDWGQDGYAIEGIRQIIQGSDIGIEGVNYFGRLLN